MTQFIYTTNINPKISYQFKIKVFWNITLYLWLNGSQYFGGSLFLCFQDQEFARRAFRRSGTV